MTGSGGVSSTARGAILIGVLVIAGIVGLQILDDSGADMKLGDTTSTLGPAGASTSTTAATRQPSQVRVKVYNASGVDGQGGAMRDKLKSQGWDTTPAADTITPTRTGTAVQCVAGFENEAAALATGVGQGAVVETYPSNPPAGADQADCLVILGKS